MPDDPGAWELKFLIQKLISVKHLPEHDRIKSNCPKFIIFYHENHQLRQSQETKQQFGFLFFETVLLSRDREGRKTEFRQALNFGPGANLGAGKSVSD